MTSGQGNRNAEPGRHPIRVVAERTGLSLDVLRVWERRYGVVEPARDEAGRRLYTDLDVERLRLLAQAVSAGRSIGRIAKLPISELAELVRGDQAARRAVLRAGEPAGAIGFVEDAMARARTMDAAGLENVLRRAASMLGVPVFLELVVGTLLRRIGEEWESGEICVAQEHMVSGVARAVVTVVTGTLPLPASAPRVVVATLSGERHELGALLAASTAAVEGWDVIYLGADLPVAELSRTVAQTAARVVAISVIHVPVVAEVTAQLEQLCKLLPRGVEVVAGGAGTAALTGVAERTGSVVLDSLADFRLYLRDRASA
jgi:MerR family transcriptional regulator, light-induced transcriptional regulator